MRIRLQNLKPYTELSVLIPVYNEKDNVEALYYELVAVLEPKKFSFEVIFVDDGSDDNTASTLENLRKKDARLRVLCHKRNYGQSAALISGARAARYPLLVTLDGDGQNDPADIPLLLEHYADIKTVVLGNRIKRDDNLLRKWSSRIGNGIRKRVLEDGCPDTGCSLRIFSRQGFLNLPQFNHMHRFLPSLFKKAGFTLVNLPVNHRARKFGVSKYGVMNRLFVGIHDLMGVRWLLKRFYAAEVCKHD